MYSLAPFINDYNFWFYAVILDLISFELACWGI